MVAVHDSRNARVEDDATRIRELEERQQLMLEEQRIMSETHGWQMEEMKKMIEKTTRANRGLRTYSTMTSADDIWCFFFFFLFYVVVSNKQYIIVRIERLQNWILF